LPEAINCTGELTLAPFTGEVIVTTPVVEAAATVIVILFV
jgi:hypothetical protein